MNFEALAQYLQDEGVASIGSTLFAYEMPASVSVGVLLLPSPSAEKIDYELPGYFKTTIQAIVRHADRAEGFALAELVMSKLNLKHAVIGDMTIRRLRPNHRPLVYPVSKGDLLEFSVNYDAIYLTA